MKDLDKTKNQLIRELNELRDKVLMYENSFALNRDLKREHDSSTAGKRPKSSEQHIIEQNHEILEYLQESRLFASFPKGLIEQLLIISKFREIPKGEKILEEGEKNTKVYFLLGGEVSLSIEGQHILNLRRRGDIFGERSAVGGFYNLSTVIAKTPVKVFSIKNEDIGNYSEIGADEFRNFLYRLFAIIMMDKLSLTTYKAKKYEITQNKLLKEIEEHKKSEEELKKSGKKYRSLIESAPEPVVIVKGENIVYANPVAINNIGYTEKELYKMSFFNLVLKSALNETSKCYEQRKKGAADPSFEIQLVTKSKEVRLAEGTVVEIEWERKQAFLYLCP